MVMSANGQNYSLEYDITAGFPAVVEDSAASSVAYYIREPNGALIARYDSTNGMRYYDFDEIGSIRLITDSDGSVTDMYDNDADRACLGTSNLEPGSTRVEFDSPAISVRR